MSTRGKAVAILGVTFLLGLAAGFLVSGALHQRRAERMAELRRRGGFVEHMLDVIQPRDTIQREAIVPILEETAQENQALFEGTRESLRAGLDSMRVRLAPLLDADQLRRLEREARFRGGPRRGGPPSGGPPGGPMKGPGEGRPAPSPSGR
jgi:hypothetical protein